MTRTVDVPEDICDCLVEESTRRGCTVAEFIAWNLEQARKEREREELFNRINVRREKHFAEHGLSPDCVPMIREDRDR